MSFVTDCSLYFLVFVSKLPLTFSYSSKLSWFWSKTSVSGEDSIIFICNKCRSPLTTREKVSIKQTVNDVENEYNTKSYISYNNNSTFVSPIYTFSSAAIIIAYTPIQGTNRDKYFNRIIYKKMSTLAENKHLSVHFFFHRPRLLHLSTEKIRVQSDKKGHQSGYSRANSINIINKR